MRLHWQVLWNTEGGSGGDGGAGGAGGAAGGAGGAGGEGGAPGGVPGGDKGAGGGQQQLSLRAQMASMLEGDAKSQFEEWGKKYATDADFGKAIHNMRSTYDQRVVMPGADAPPEERHKFFQKLGKPNTATDYKFEWGDEKPDNATTARFEAFKKFAFDENLTQTQFEKLVQLNNKFAADDGEAALAQLDEAQERSSEALRKAWGVDYDANLEYAIAAGADLADSSDEWKALMDMPIIGKEGTMRVGDHPTLLKVLAKVGRAYSEDTRIRISEKTGERQSIQAQIEAIEEEARKAGRKTSEEHYHNRLMPLYAKLHPGKTRATGVR